MNVEHRRILSDKRDILVEKVNFLDLKQLLRDNKLFNEYMWKDIASMEDLLDALPHRGPKAFHTIIEILRKTGYNQEASALESSVTKIIYKMSSRPLGYCLIINNVEFQNDLYRYGSDCDAESLSYFFKNAGFEVVEPLNSLRNMKAGDMIKFLTEFSKREDLENVDSLIVIIMSHGAQVDNVDIVYGTDWKYIKKPDVCNIFNNKNCELLQNKPKTFIFISCRGEHKDYGVIPRCLPNESRYTGCKSLEYDVPCLPSNVSLDAINIKVIPTVSDTFILHSTLPCQPSLRDHEKGSYFCQALIDVLNTHYQNKDLYKMHIYVNQKLITKVSTLYRITQSVHYEALGAMKIFKLCRS